MIITKSDNFKGGIHRRQGDAQKRERKLRSREGETMSKQARVSHPIHSLLPTEIEGFDSLAELALDMRWSWNHATETSGGSLIPSCGKSLITPGLSCRREIRTTETSSGSFRRAGLSVCPAISVAAGLPDRRPDPGPTAIGSLPISWRRIVARVRVGRGGPRKDRGCGARRTFWEFGFHGQHVHVSQATGAKPSSHSWWATQTQSCYAICSQSVVGLARLLLRSFGRRIGALLLLYHLGQLAKLIKLVVRTPTCQGDSSCSSTLIGPVFAQAVKGNGANAGGLFGGLLCCAPRSSSLPSPSASRSDVLVNLSKTLARCSPRQSDDGTGDGLVEPGAVFEHRLDIHHRHSKFRSR